MRGSTKSQLMYAAEPGPSPHYKRIHALRGKNSKPPTLNWYAHSQAEAVKSPISSDIALAFPVGEELATADKTVTEAALLADELPPVISKLANVSSDDDDESLAELQ